MLLIVPLASVHHATDCKFHKAHAPRLDLPGTGKLNDVLYVLTVHTAKRDVVPDSESWDRVILFIADTLFKHAKWMGSVRIAFILNS